MAGTKIAHLLLFLLNLIICFNKDAYASLLEGTLVATAHGLVPIQTLKVGDKVLGYNLNAPSYNEALCEVAVTKINKHITDALFTVCTKNGWVEASPHQLIFTLIPEAAQNGDACVMDFVQAQDITKDCMLIDVHMNCLAIVKTNRLNLSCSYPKQYIEKVKRNRHKKVTAVVRYVVDADVYALEVEEPHVFLIAEYPHATDMSKTRLLLTHNGIPALAAGVSLVFDATPASLAFAEATASVGGLGVVFGPAGVALGLVTGIGYIGYQLFKSDSKGNGQSHFYIEHAGPGSPGGYDPKEPKNNDNEKISTNIDDLNEGKIKHIVEGSKGSNHKWEKLVPDKNWTDIKKVINNVMETGKDKPYKADGCARTKEILGQTVEVTYKIMENGIYKIGNAWVK